MKKDGWWREYTEQRLEGFQEQAKPNFVPELALGQKVKYWLASGFAKILLTLLLWMTARQMKKWLKRIEYI